MAFLSFVAVGMMLSRFLVLATAVLLAVSMMSMSVSAVGSVFFQALIFLNFQRYTL
jgi:hypothetical protein